MLYFKLFIVVLYINFASACHPQFEKELRYLDLYLGLIPEDDGELPVKDNSKFASYIASSGDLDCSFDEKCLWKNSKTDSLLDTSEWWYFQKSDDKPFPVQIQPGKQDIKKGTHLIVAGNTTTTSESAVLLSAPVACQKGFGNLTFSYWLYNNAKLEVVIVRASNRRTHLQALLRPSMDCHFLRPANDICTVQIPPIDEPYRIAIRAFNLKDNVVGSMALLSNISYSATVCGESPFPSVFSSSPLNPVVSKDINQLSDLNCERPLSNCMWENSYPSLSEWKVGRSLDKWQKMMDSSKDELKPNSSFLFLVVDSLSPRPYSVLRSHIIPCTQRATTLSFRYWLKTGTQVEICSVDEKNVPLSCAYLTEEDAPGPIEVDAEAYDQPFRFTVEIIAFDETSVGLVALSDIKVTGLLCKEEPPPVVTTINPPIISSMFGLQQGYGSLAPYPLTLSCDFSQDYCSQWVNDDGHVVYGAAPRSSDKFPIPPHIKGNVAVFMLEKQTSSILRSREVSCAKHATVTVNYMRSQHTNFSICAIDRCVRAKDSSGSISITISSPTPFEFSLEAKSTSNSIVVISSIQVEGDICPLRSAEKISCDKIECGFRDSLCEYKSPLIRLGDVAVTTALNGAEAILNQTSTRSILLSPVFDLQSPVDLRIVITQNAFGSRLLICPTVDSESEDCHELLGPKVERSSTHDLTFALDARARQFAIVMLHPHAMQFGDAMFKVHMIRMQTANGTSFC
ncbi:unnamed protein product [Auanema sp. JU1783]|nr:unnamed protein product [Auanema sp. JU1783]